MSGTTTILDSAGRTLFRLGFEISPIILTNGIVEFMPGGMLPIVALLEGPNFISGLFGNPSGLTSLDNFFAHFRPLPGATLVNNDVGMYPFANQTTAANAIIAKPLNISLLMMTPVNKPGGNPAKFATFLALQAALQQHNLRGGTYSVATPAFLYTNCILTLLQDVSQGEQAIPQNTWRFDFIKPLITLGEAAAAQNTLMNKLSNGLPTDGSLSGPSITPGYPLTGATAATVPSAENLTGISGGAGGYQSAAVVPVQSSPLP